MRVQNRSNKSFRLAVGSFKEEYANNVEIIQREPPCCTLILLKLHPTLWLPATSPQPSLNLSLVQTLTERFDPALVEQQDKRLQMIPCCS